MKSSICCVVLVAILLSDQPYVFASGFGYELIQERLDHQQNMIERLSGEVTELRETVLSNHRMMEMLVSSLEISFSQMVLNQTQLLLKQFEETQPTPNEDLTPNATCQAVNVKKSGRFHLDNGTVFCEMDSFGGGWLVIQQRLDGSESFHRNWTQYREGFGTVGRFSEFWLGLERIHQLTKTGDHELVVELKSAAGEYRYGRYREFAIGGEGEKYSLVRLGDHSGTAEDELSAFHKGAKFSTFDSDNDLNSMHNYASYTGGGWWINNSMKCNLNGPYVENARGYGIWWSSFSRGLKYSRMMIRRTP